MTALMEMAATGQEHSGDDTGSKPDPAVWIESACDNGYDLTYTLHTPRGSVSLSADEFLRLNDETFHHGNARGDVIVASRRDRNRPDWHGLVRFDPGDQVITLGEAHVYHRPGATADDPYVIWEDPEPQAVFNRGHEQNGRWLLRLPLHGGGRPVPPLGEATWDDETGVADLAALARDPEAAWTLYAMAHPDEIRNHRRIVAQAEERARQKAVEDANAQANRDAWSRISTACGVTGDLLRKTLRNAGVGDTWASSRVFLAFESLPMPPRLLLTDPRVADRFGFTGTPDESAIHSTSRAWSNAKYPTAAWRMILKTYTSHNLRLCPSLPTAEQERLGREWAEKVAAAVAPRRLSVVRRDDGYWVIRDEAVFDLLYARLLAHHDPEDFGGLRFGVREGRLIAIPNGMNAVPKGLD